MKTVPLDYGSANHGWLFVPQCLHNLLSADVPCREGDAEAHYHEQEQIDDEGDDEEVRPELVDPIILHA